MFEYANNNYKKLERYTYTKIYQDYSYDYLLSLIPKKEKFIKNSGHITLKEKLTLFFDEYTKIINLFKDLEANKKIAQAEVNTNSGIYSDIYSDYYNNNNNYANNNNNKINNNYTNKEAIKELNLNKDNDLASNLINAYYFNFKSSIYL